MKRSFEIARVPGAPVATEELLADLRRVASGTGSLAVTMKAYAEEGEYDPSTIKRRFGTWNSALLAAGLSVSAEQMYSDERLFENVLRLWEHYGRQPRMSELLRSPSTISDSPYKRRFNTWISCLHAFADFANGEEIGAPQVSGKTPQTPRAISLRLRFKIMKRDNFRCRACGASPSLKPGLVLHVDHVEAWSNGGTTLEENLQTLCEPCNLGKSNT